MQNLHSFRFWILALASWAFGLFITLLLPVPIPLPGGMSMQLAVSCLFGYGAARLFVSHYPEVQITRKNVLAIIPWWGWAAFVGLLFWSGMTQGLSPLEIAGTVVGVTCLGVGLPWLLWWIIKDYVALVQKLFRR